MERTFNGVNMQVSVWWNNMMTRSQMLRVIGNLPRSVVSVSWYPFPPKNSMDWRQGCT